MINVSEIIREWEADGEWRVSPGVDWCAAGNRVIVGKFVSIGDDVKIGNYVGIGNDVKIGKDVSLADGVRIGDCVIIGDYVSIGKFVSIGKDVKIGDDVIVGNCVKISDGVIVGNCVSVGADVSLADGVRISDGVKIGKAVGIGNYVSIGKDVKIGNYVSIGAGIRISDGTSISDCACISAEPHTYNRDGCTSVPVGADTVNLRAEMAKAFEEIAAMLSAAPVPARQPEGGAVAWMVSGGGYQPTLHFSKENAAEAASDSDSVAPFGMSDDELAKVTPLYLYPERDALDAKVRELEADAARSFNHGVLLAAGFLDCMHDQPTMAADIIREMGLVGYDCSHLDPFDKDSLRKICTQSGIRLKGLGAKARLLNKNHDDTGERDD